MASLDYLEGSNSASIPVGGQVVVHYLALRPAGENVSMPVLSQYRWTRPEAPRYSRQDFLFMHYVLAAAARSDDVDELAWLRGQAASIPDGRPDYAGALGQSVLEPFFESLRVSGDAAREPRGATPAERLQSWMCGGDREDVAGPDPQRRGITLSGVVDGGRIVAALGTPDYWFLGDEPATYVDPPSRWWGGAGQRPSLTAGRMHIELRVPVWHQEGGDPEYYPACWSVADLERELGREVEGLYREWRFLPADVAGEQLLRDRAGRFPIWFQSRRPLDDHLQLEDADKAAVLIAPGDIIRLGAPAAREGGGL